MSKKKRRAAGKNPATGKSGGPAGAQPGRESASEDRPPSRPANPNDQPPNPAELASRVGNGHVLDLGVHESVGEPSLSQRLKTAVIGKPRDLTDRTIFHRVSLVAFLAWVGLGADGLSSSCYGPPEAFAMLGEHRYLAIFLAMAIMFTVFVISTCYSHIIEEFPTGGGGYLVASKLLGNRFGVISGCALLVDYVLTITVSIAAAGDAVFGLLGPAWFAWKVPAELMAIVVLIVLNLRGVKESVQMLLPIFLVFLLTHFLLIVGSIGLHVPAAASVAGHITDEVRAGLASPQLGLWGMVALLLHAYSMGAGTYTGLEAVSNSMPVMREPRVATGKRTMRYMAYSLAFTAGGLIVAYLLLNIQPRADKTLNHVLAETFVAELHLGWLGMAFVLATLFSEGMLLVVGAQAGFIDGPRVLANMAQDSWMPHWFANLSERLATRNGILLMGVSALAALIYTHGDVRALVVMYSINVFITFSLSMIGMCRFWWRQRGSHPLWRRRLALFVAGAVLCLAILMVNGWEKRDEGGPITILVTGCCVGLCFFINRHYREVGARLKRLDETLDSVPTLPEPNMAEPDRGQPAAVVLVGGFSGLGLHTLLNAVRFAPNYHKSFVFISVGVVDSGNFKGSGAVDDLRRHTEDSLAKYVDLGRSLGMPSTAYYAIGTDAVDELEQLCRRVAREFTRATVFAGQLVFQKDTFLQRLLHNQTAYSLQRRLQWDGMPMVILPTRVR